jgi:3',5'-cyclic AMP phosphodiesterase CpdA
MLNPTRLSDLLHCNKVTLPLLVNITMEKYLLYLMILAFLLFSCTNVPEDPLPVDENAPTIQLKKYTKEFNFYVISDLGKNGHKNQQDIANQMAALTDRVDPQFIVSCGNNFESSGVESVEDPLWKSEFENVYKKPSLQVDWFPVLGNHDYKGNSQAEIDYSKISSRWRFNSRYYTFVRKINDSVSARFIFLDTAPLIGKYYKKDGYPDIAKQDSARQIAWLKAVLANSNEQWKLVFGHHSIFSSNIKEGNKTELIQRIKPILEKYNVQFYISGHDRDLQHLKESGRKLDYMVIGASSETQPSSTSEMSLFSKSASAFSAITFHGDSIRYAFINSKGLPEYSFERSYK